MKFILHSIFFLVLGFGLLYAYLNYSEDIYQAIFDRPVTYTIFVGSLGVDVTLADDPEERRQGLSGTEGLKELEGKLFLFDESKKHGFWMKDMNYALDILWINNDLEIVHIEENVSPDTYPKIFGPDEDARYVLEMKAFFVDTYRIEEGDKLILPPGLLPPDIKSSQSDEYSN